MLSAELGIPHACGISLEIVGFDAKPFRPFGIVRLDGSKSLNELFDFPVVEQTPRVNLHPGFLIRQVISVQLARQFPEVLTRVINIYNLNRARKVWIGEIPDPFGSIAHHNAYQTLRRITSAPGMGFCVLPSRTVPRALPVAVV